MSQKKCSICSNTKLLELFYSQGNICKDCNNERRRKKYSENEEYRKKLIKKATETKHNKVVQKQKKLEEEKKKLHEEIGETNEICKYCKKIQPKE